MWVLHLYFKFIIVAVFILIPLIFSCDDPGKPILPVPDDVQMVPHAFADDTAATERGVDAVPESEGIYIAWYSLNDRNVKQYNIYRREGDEPGSYFGNKPYKIINLEVAAPGKDTTYVDDNADAGLTPNIYYYYFVTATNKDNEEGSAVDTLRYQLLRKPDTELPNGESYDPDIDGLPTLFWYFPDEHPAQYILRIENYSFDRLHYIGIFNRDYSNERQELDLNSVPNLPEFLPGIYRWRIDSIGPDPDNSGSESSWKVFNII